MGIVSLSQPILMSRLQLVSAHINFVHACNIELFAVLAKKLIVGSQTLQKNTFELSHLKLELI